MNNRGKKGKLKMLETVACDYCGSSECTTVAKQTDKLHQTTDEAFTIVRCAACGLHYTNPRPSVNEIGRYYAEDYSFHAASSKNRRFALRVAESLANGYLARVLGVVHALGRRFSPYVKPRILDPVRTFYSAGGKGTFLDIGCGSGVSAHFWGESGALLAYRQLTEVAGVEVAASARESLASFGIEAWDCLDAVPTQRRFGVIRMNWSLEHVHSPSQYFSFLRERLLPGGRVVIAIPNYDGQIYRLAPDCVELPIHLYHFRPRDIENYASRNGLRIVGLRTFSYPQMYVYATQVGLFPAPFPKQLGLRAARAFQLALDLFDQAGWGNDMIVELELDA